MSTSLRQLARNGIAQELEAVGFYTEADMIKKGIAVSEVSAAMFAREIWARDGTFGRALACLRTLECTEDPEAAERRDREERRSATIATMLEIVDLWHIHLIEAEFAYYAVPSAEKSATLGRLLKARCAHDALLTTVAQYAHSDHVELEERVRGLPEHAREPMWLERVAADTLARLSGDRGRELPGCDDLLVSTMPVAAPAFDDEPTSDHAEAT